MKRKWIWFLIVMMVLMVASPVFAQSQTYFHEVTVELDGEWEWNGSFIAPEVITTTALKGTGKAMIHAITKAQSVPVWWELF